MWGHALLCLAENSHKMVEIQNPESGMTVEDILNQTKLFLRPLQKDIANGGERSGIILCIA